MDLTDEEIIGWQAYERFEPWGCAVEDYRAGKIIAALHLLFNAHHGIKYGSGTDPQEHFPGYDKVEREKRVKRMKATRSLRRNRESGNPRNTTRKNLR